MARILARIKARHNKGKCAYQMHESHTAIAELPLSSCLCEYILVIIFKTACQSTWQPAHQTTVCDERHCMARLHISMAFSQITS